MTTTTPMSRTAEKARELHKDQKGAIMLMGLCMSCFLIGGLWFVIGIGDAIVFRDQMQEATDHAAFTSAVLHAKGMNFISACNLILVALIAIHILMGIIHDILLAICIISLGFGCGAWVSWRRVYTTYGKGFKMAANVIHYLEEGAAIGYPFLGAYKGWRVGADYGTYGKKRDLMVVPISTSMAPGSVMNGIVNKLFKQAPAEKLPPGVQGPTRPATSGYSPAKKKFLPVEAKPFKSVCERIANKSLDSLIALTGRNPSGKVMGIVKKIIGAVLTFRYCNDLGSSGSVPGGYTDSIKEGNDAIDTENASRQANNQNLPKGATPQPDIEKVKMDGIGGSIDPGFDKWWGKDGPLVPWGGTKNGSAWQQVWAINWMPEYEDYQQNKVALGQRKYGQSKDQKSMIYVAQAEFFFDCTKDWADLSCGKDDNAGYQIKWRARLRQVTLPQIGSMLSSFATDFLKNMAGYKSLKDSIKKAVTSGNPMGGGAFDGVVAIFESYAGKAINGAGGLIDDGQNAITGALGNWLNLTPYH